MTAPLVSFQGELDPRTFPLDHCSSERLDQGFDVGEHDRSKSETREDRLKRFPVLRVHRLMLAKSDIVGKTDRPTPDCAWARRSLMATFPITGPTRASEARLWRARVHRAVSRLRARSHGSGARGIWRVACNAWVMRHRARSAMCRRSPTHALSYRRQQHSDIPVDAVEMRRALPRCRRRNRPARALTHPHRPPRTQH